MLKGSKKYWVIALLCGLVTAYLSYQYLQQIENQYRPDNMIEVVKARIDINKDTIITAKELETQEIPAQYVHPDALMEKEKVIGKIAVNDLSAGEVIINEKLVSSKDKSSRLSYSIPNYQRAVSIAIDNVTGVSGFITPGDRVDIVATLDIPLLDPRGNEKTKTFNIMAMQDIQVLEVGDKYRIANDRNSSESKTLTLAVPTQDVQALVLAAERGRLRVLLRSPVDSSRTNSTPYELEDFLKSGGI